MDHAIFAVVALLMATPCAWAAERVCPREPTHRGAE